MNLGAIEIGHLSQRIAEAVENEDAPPAAQMKPAIMILGLDCLKRRRIGNAGAGE